MAVRSPALPSLGHGGLVRDWGSLGDHPLDASKCAKTITKRKKRDLQARASKDEEARSGLQISRQSLLKLLTISPLVPLLGENPALSLTTTSFAGRVPGLSEPDSEGLRTYKRPDNKSGGHGVGWSPFAPYSFRVSQGWEEVPVSIADLGGTEIDLRFQSSNEGNLVVIIAPVLRFTDGLGDNARIELIGSPERLISAFGPEITGASIEGKVRSMNVRQVDGLNYYDYEIDPHSVVTMTAKGNRLYIISVSANSRQWKKYSSSLRNIAHSFQVA